VLALDPALTDGQRRALTELQINLVCRDPRGFALINDETLSRTADTRPVSVRRLLILLKRLALREGAAYVFEPLTSDFPDRVRHRFQRLLSNLHLRGAFQGENAQDAFGVVVDASINPPRSLDLGRFVVELRVAPSRPLAFLRVRLIQSGPQELAVGEL
jgi:phage tail sheath protein FI